MRLLRSFLITISIAALLISPLLVAWIIDYYLDFPMEILFGGIGFILFFISMVSQKEDGNEMGIGCLFLLYFIIFLFFGPAIISRLQLASHDVRGVYYSENKTDSLRITGSTRHKVVLEFKGEKIDAKVKGKTIYLKDGTVLNYTEWDEQSQKPDETIVHCQISGKLKGNTISFSNQFIRITSDYVPVGEMIN